MTGSRQARDGGFELTLRFDRFGRRWLRGAAARQGRTLEALLAAALAHLQAGIEGGRPAAAPPSFLAGRSDAETSVRLATPAELLEHLRGEARRRQVPLERLVEHSLLLYLADLDAER